MICAAPIATACRGAIRSDGDVGRAADGGAIATANKIDDATDDPRRDHRTDAEQVVLDRIFERDADDRRRDERDHEREQDAPPVRIAPDDTVGHGPQPREVQHDDGEDRAGLDRDRVRVGGVLGLVGLADVEQVAR